jgi:hypothetical protein
MKKILWLAIILLLVDTVAAEISMRVISYDSDTKEAKILVANIGQTEYSDIVFTMDNVSMDFKGDVLSPNMGFTLPRVVSPGIHTAKVVAREGTFEAKLLFARTAKTTPENFIVKGQNVEPENVVAAETKSNWYYYAIFAIVTLAIAGVVFYFATHPDSWKRIVEFFHAKPAVKPKVQSTEVYQAAQIKSPLKRVQRRQEKKEQRAKIFEQFGGKK